MRIANVVSISRRAWLLRLTSRTGHRSQRRDAPSTIRDAAKKFGRLSRCSATFADQRYAWQDRRGRQHRRRTVMSAMSRRPAEDNRANKPSTISKTFVTTFRSVTHPCRGVLLGPSSPEKSTKEIPELHSGGSSKAKGHKPAQHRRKCRRSPTKTEPTGPSSTTSIPRLCREQGETSSCSAATSV